MTKLQIPFGAETSRFGLSDLALLPVYQSGRQPIGMSERMVETPWKRDAIGDCGFPIPVVEPRFQFTLPNLNWLIVLEGSLSRTFLETAYEIDRLSLLRNGWDSYGAMAIQSEAIEAALILAARILTNETPNPSVVPMSSGGISFEWHLNDSDLEIEVEGNQNCQVSSEDLRNGTTREFNFVVGDERELLTLLQSVIN